MPLPPSRPPQPKKLTDDEIRERYNESMPGLFQKKVPYKPTLNPIDPSDESELDPAAPKSEDTSGPSV